MYKFIRRIWNYVKDELEAYCVIIIGITVTVLGFLNEIPFNVVAAAVLLLLSYLTFNLARIKSVVQENSNRFKNNLLYESRLPDEITKKQLSGSKEIKLGAVTLFRFLPNIRPSIEEALRKGGCLKILIVDPDGIAINTLGIRSPSKTPVEVERKRILDTISIVRHLQEEFPQSDIELRAIDYIPSHSVTILEPFNKGKSRFCYVRLYPFKATSVNAPAVIIDSDDNRVYFDYFNSQFDRMWETARRIPLKESINVQVHRDRVRVE